jgi:pyruvate formate lyase activating enzyme
MKALIGDIGRYALHDGPGIRTTVFFKGCSLRCPWCHNPELIAPDPEIMFYPQRCIGCGDCAAICPRHAFAGESTGATLQRQQCDGCGLCARICPTKALELVGRRYTVDALVDVLLRDRLYYETSGGGVTLSGGEATLYMTDMQALLQRLQQEHIHTALETNGTFSMEAFQDHCLDCLDVIYVDIKIADPDLHRSVTGTGNHRIWSNLAALKKLRPNAVVPRIPVIPGYTAMESNMRQLAQRLKALGFRSCVLLPYHPHGLAKAGYLGRKAAALPREAMSAAALASWRPCFQWPENDSLAGPTGPERGVRSFNYQGGERCN